MEFGLSVVMNTLAQRLDLNEDIQTITMRPISAIVISFLMTISVINSVSAQKTKYQSIFIYNFSKYIKWPENYNQGKFVIGVLGETELYKDLYTMASAKKETNGLTLEVKQFKSIENISDCNLLFLSEKYCDKITQVQAAVSGKPMLIMTDKKGMAKNGAVINFVEDSGKIKFELNQSAADQLGIIISSSLANLAILV